MSQPILQHLHNPTLIAISAVVGSGEAHTSIPHNQLLISSFMLPCSFEEGAAKLKDFCMTIHLPEDLRGDPTVA